MERYVINESVLNERQLRAYVRQSILFEYNDAKRIRAMDPVMFDYFATGYFVSNTHNLNENWFMDGLSKIGSAVAGAGEFLMTGAGDVLGMVLGKERIKAWKSWLGGKIAGWLNMTPGTKSEKATIAFVQGSSTKDVFNIIRGRSGCGKTLLLFTSALVKLITKDVPNILGMEPEGKITKGIQKYLGDPINSVAKMLADAMCAINWSKLVAGSGIMGAGLIAKFLPGGSQEGKKITTDTMGDAAKDLTKKEQDDLKNLVKTTAKQGGDAKGGGDLFS